MEQAEVLWLQPALNAVARLLGGAGVGPELDAATIEKYEWELHREGLLGIVAFDLVARGGAMNPRVRELTVREVGCTHHARFILREIGQALAPLSFIVFKGGSLGFQEYPGPGLRPLSDLDLLVRPQDWAALKSGLENLGFAEMDSQPHMHAREGWTLDLHVHPLNQVHAAYRLDLDQVWAEARPHWDDVPNVLALSPEQNLVVCSLHAGKHFFSRWIWLIDLALLMRTLPIEPALEVVRRSNALRNLSYANILLERGLGWKTPAPWRAHLLPPSRLSWIERRFLEAIPSRSVSESMGMLMPIFSLPGVRAKLGYLRQVLYPKGQSLRERNRRLWQLGQALIRLIRKAG